MKDWIQLVGPSAGMLSNAYHNTKAAGLCGFSCETRRLPAEQALASLRTVGARVVSFRAFWCPAEVMVECATKIPQTQFWLSNHSSPQQLMDSREWDALHAAAPKFSGVPNIGINSVDYRTVEFIKAEFPDLVVRHTPNIYFLEGVLERAPRPADEFHLGLFLAFRPHKNWGSQVQAAVILGRRLQQEGRRLYVHVTQQPWCNYGAPILQLAGAVNRVGGAVVQEGYFDDHRRFVREVVNKMTVCSQASYAETFSYAAGDSIEAGVPVVGSAGIPWLPGAWQADAANVVDIADKLHAAERWDPRVGLDALLAYNRVSAPLALANLGLCTADEAQQRVQERLGGMT